MDLWILRVDVLPRGRTIPLLSHVFFGETRQQVDFSFHEHMKDDSFLREAYVASHSKGTIRGMEIEVVTKYETKTSNRKAV